MAGYSARVTMAQAGQIVTATQSVIRGDITACMTKAGDQYYAPRQAAAERTVLLSSLSRATSVDDARQRGLNVSIVFRDPGAPTPTDPADAAFSTYLAAMSPQEHSRYSRQLSTCTNRALRPLTESSGSLLRRLKSSYLAEVLDDDTLTGAHATWMSCMAARGHHVSNVAGLINELKPLSDAVVQSVDPTTPNAQPDPGKVDDLWRAERSAAVDQAQCDITAYGPIIGPWSSLERRWERRHRHDLAAMSDQLRLGWGNIVGL
jgi:hypothetical protein